MKERELYNDFKTRWDSVLQKFEEIEDERGGKAKAITKYRLMPFIYQGKHLSKFVLENKKIPARYTKQFELASRAFLKVRRKPTKPKTWLERNERHIRFLLKTKEFSEKTLGGNELFEVGPFTVHNVINLSGEKLGIAEDLITKASRFIRQSGIPHSRKLLYGDVFLTGQIQRAKTNAWYDIRADNISVRIKGTIDSETVHSLVHEFGHRLWRLFLGKDVQLQWHRWHRRVGRERPDVDLPKEGELLGFEVSGLGEPVVEKVEANRFYVGDGGGYVTYDQVMKTYKQKFSFPTPYSSVSAEEHFCEAFAMYCMGTLSSKHESNFEELIVLGRELI